MSTQQKVVSIHDKNARLYVCETIIKGELTKQFGIGDALAEIRDDKLYAGQYDSFEEYCYYKWGIKKAHAYRLITASETINNLQDKAKQDSDSKSPIGDVLPENEGQVREIAKASPEEQPEVWQQAQELTGKEQPSAKEIKQIVDKKNQNIANQFSTETNEWYTPDCIIEDVFQVMGDIDLDPCSDPGGNIAAKARYTQKDDGLKQKWSGRVFMNPPYSGEALQWADKIIHEDETIDQAIVLVASNTDARYFHQLLGWCNSVCFVKGRLEFKPGEGQKASRSTVRNVIFYMGDNNEEFDEHFSKHGSVLWLR